MKINIRTAVAGNYKSLIKRFDRSLFEALVPPGMSVELIQFDGSNLGDTVHIRLSLAGIIKEDWVSKITEEDVDAEKAWFTDEGVKLPFFLKKWQHRHIVEKNGENSTIVDDITFQTPFILMDYLMYPILYLQFAWRKPIYRKIFGRVED